MSTQHALETLVRESFPEFDPALETHRIRAEKILKAKQRIDSSLNNEDIDAFLQQLTSEKRFFSGYEKDKNLLRIIEGDYQNINQNEMFIIYASDEELYYFGQHYTSQFIDYIRKNIQDNNWNNLSVLYKYYHKVLSYEAESYLKQQIDDRNQIIIPLLSQTERYHELMQYQYPIMKDYYQFQSDLDGIYFEDNINVINNQVADNQKTSYKNKAVLGRILFALSHFETDDPELKLLLEKNGKVGAKWAKLDSDNKYSSTTKDKEAKVLSPEEDAALNKKIEWLIIGVYIAVVGFIIYKGFSWIEGTMLNILIGEAILFLIFYKSLKKRYEANSTSQEPLSFRLRMKKFCFMTFMLQIYIVIIALVIALVAAAIALIIYSRGLGIIALVLLYRWLKKK